MVAATAGASSASAICIKYLPSFCRLPYLFFLPEAYSGQAAVRAIFHLCNGTSIIFSAESRKSYHKIDLSPGKNTAAVTVTGI